jgi:hypothetical protein
MNNTGSVAPVRNLKYRLIPAPQQLMDKFSCIASLEIADTEVFELMKLPFERRDCLYEHLDTGKDCKNLRLVPKTISTECTPSFFKKSTFINRKEEVVSNSWFKASADSPLPNSFLKVYHQVNPTRLREPLSAAKQVSQC